MASLDTEDEAPLDPAAARLRGRLVRLLFVSGGIMVLGLVAVFAAIIYKLNAGGEGKVFHPSADLPVSAAIAVPPGQTMVGASLDGDRALLTLVATDGTTSLLLVDLASGKVLGRYSLETKQ